MTANAVLNTLHNILLTSQKCTGLKVAPSSKPNQDTWMSQMLHELEEIRLNPNTPLSLLQGVCFVHCMALEILGFHAINQELGMHRFL